MFKLVKCKKKEKQSSTNCLPSEHIIQIKVNTKERAAVTETKTDVVSGLWPCAFFQLKARNFTAKPDMPLHSCLKPCVCKFQRSFTQIWEQKSKFSLASGINFSLQRFCVIKTGYHVSILQNFVSNQCQLSLHNIFLIG